MRRETILLHLAIKFFDLSVSVVSKTKDRVFLGSSKQHFFFFLHKPKEGKFTRETTREKEMEEAQLGALNSGDLVPAIDIMQYNIWSSRPMNSFASATRTTSLAFTFFFLFQPLDSTFPYRQVIGPLAWWRNREIIFIPGRCYCNPRCSLIRIDRKGLEKF